MGILNKTKTYLIGPMEFEDGRAWRDDISDFLSKRGITIFDPYKKPFIGAFSESVEDRESLIEKRSNGRLGEIHEHMKMVRAQDLSMVDRSDFLICFISPNVPTFGTIEELVTAVRAKRPVFIVVDGGKNTTPLWLLGMFPPKYFYNSFEEVKDMLALIDDGKVEIDSDRWRLLKPELR